MELKSRDRCIDVLKGIGIFLVVFNHVSWGKYAFVYIQSFHMQLFFVVSGFLWKQQSIKEISIKRARTLIGPYFIFMFLFLLVDRCFHLNNETVDIVKSLRAIVFFPTDNTNMPIASAMWFLPCLYLASVIYSILGRLNFKVKTVVIFLITICGTVYSSLCDNMLPLTLEPLAAALMFMLVGEYIKMNRLNMVVTDHKPFYIFGLLALEAFLAFINGSVDLRSARFHIVPLYFINGILGTFAYWGISKWIEELRTGYGGIIRKELICFGEYSIVVLCLHQLFISLMNKFLAGIISQGTIYESGCKFIIFIVTMLLCKIIIIGCKSYTPVKKLFGIRLR